VAITHLVVERLLRLLLAATLLIELTSDQTLQPHLNLGPTHLFVSSDLQSAILEAAQFLVPMVLTIFLVVVAMVSLDLVASAVELVPVMSITAG